MQDWLAGHSEKKSEGEISPGLQFSIFQNDTDFSSSFVNPISIFETTNFFSDTFGVCHFTSFFSGPFKNRLIAKVWIYSRKRANCLKSRKSILWNAQKMWLCHQFYWFPQKTDLRWLFKHQTKLPRAFDSVGNILKWVLKWMSYSCLAKSASNKRNCVTKWTNYLTANAMLNFSIEAPGSYEIFY